MLGNASRKQLPLVDYGESLHQPPFKALKGT